MIEPGEMDDFIDYVICNNYGDIIGIKKNAPISAKEAYRKFIAKQEKAKKRGVII